MLKVTAAEQFEVRVPAIEFPCVYSLSRQGDRYTVTFDANALPYGIRAQLYRPGDPRARTQSTLPPRVDEVEGRYDTLARIFHQADVRNIPRDHVLKGAPATLTLHLREVDVAHFRPSRFMVLRLVAVRVSELDLADNLARFGEI